MIFEISQDQIRQTAARLPLIRGGKQGAINHIQARLAEWKGDARRGGDTPKEFWEAVLLELQK